MTSDDPGVWLSELLDQEMYDRRWTQTDVAAAVGVSQAAVSKWVLCKSMPDIDQAIALARALDQNLLDFLGHLWPAIADARRADAGAGARFRVLDQTEHNDLPAAAAADKRRGSGRKAARPKPPPDAD